MPIDQKIKQSDTIETKCGMSVERFEGFMLGLLTASYVCEMRAGDRPSTYATSIMRYGISCQMAAEQGRPLPDWKKS